MYIRFQVKRIFTIFSLILFIGNLHGQDLKISGSVNTDEAPLSFATVILKNAPDSTIIKAEITNEAGQFTFSGIPTGKYFIEASFVGLQAFTSSVIDLQEEAIALAPINLQASSANLDEIVVVAKKPLIEVMADKTVFNVENTLNSTGTNGFELLRKAPGVLIDNNDNVMLDGKTGVQIYINGKPSVLAGEDLTNYLRSLQSSDIAALEIITQPSSKYDAAGNAGIINIRLKKDRRLGTNGTISTGYAYGKNSRSKSSLSLNNRTKKSNFFGTYSNSFGETWSFLYLDRTQQNVRYDSKTETISDNTAHNVRVGWDLFPASKHTLGVLINGNFYNRSALGTTNTPIIPLSTGVVEQTLVANNQTDSENYNLNGNLNYRYADTLGHEVLIDVDYGTYRRDRISYQPNTYLAGTNGNSLLERNFRMITPTDISILSAKIDYSQNLWGGQLGLGAKFSQVRTDNVFQFFDVIDAENIINNDRSNQFEYTETINAAYLNYSKTLNKWNIQLGLRAEQTISLGDLTSTQSTEEDLVKRNYLDLFPSGGLTYTPNYKHSWALTYSRRIQRPNYQSLNPFESQLDELSFSKGNPFLQPQYTDNIKLSHTYKYRLTTSLSYSHIQDFFAQITDTLGSTRNFLITRNIANQKVWNIGVSYPFELAKWWSVYTSINAFHSAYEGTDEKFRAIDQSTLSLYGQNTFTLPAGFKLEVSGWFSSPSVWGGTYLTKSMGSLDLAVQKKFLNDRLSARVSVSDIFFTSPWRADMQFGELYINGTGGWESRQVRVNLSYRFGSNEVKSARKRAMGLEDEKGRVGN